MARARGLSLSTFLRDVPIFGGLEGRSLERVVGVLQDRSFKAGATIFNEGELGREMYVLRDGEVEVRRQSTAGIEVPIVRLGAGETFGEMTLVELQPRSASVIATQATRTFSLTNLDLYNLYRDDNYAYVIVLQNICRMLSRRLRKADGRICEFLAPKGLVKPKARAARARGR